VLEAGRSLQSPLLKLPPVSAHPDLTRTCAGRLLEAGISRRVIRITYNILAQLVQTVQCMAESDMLREFLVGILDIAEEGSLRFS